MIVLGLVLMLIGYLLWRPLVAVGGVLAIVGLVLYVCDVAGPIHPLY